MHALESMTALLYEFAKPMGSLLSTEKLAGLRGKRLTSSIKSINEDDEEEKESYFNAKKQQRNRNR